MILDVVWDQDGWLTPGEVHAVIGARRRLAYTTVLTTMARLSEKRASNAVAVDAPLSIERS